MEQFYWYCVICNLPLDADKGEAFLGKDGRWYCNDHYPERGGTVMAELNLDKVCDILRDEYQISAYVEQTGGGCATIYAGELRPITRPSVSWYPASGAEGPDVEVIDGKVKVVRPDVTEDRWEACAGPGWFEGPMGFINPRADTSDFCVGPDDDGEADPVYATETWTETDVVRAIVEQVGR